MRKPLLELCILLSVIFSGQSMGLPAELTAADPGVTTTTIGNLASNFSVTPMGAAAYAIPLQVPVGIQGMQPQLALTYNSASGEGLLGFGWSLAGLSAVTRCPQMLPQDGASKAVDYTDSDRFCLDGQRLMLVSAGPYGSDGSEYRTELNAFSKIVAHGASGTGPAWFEVWTKAGWRYEYGNAPTAYETASGAIKSMWYVNRVEDLSHNYMTYSYYFDTTAKRQLPQLIAYTNNDAVSGAGGASVEFQYRRIPVYANNGLSAGDFLRLARIVVAGAPLGGEQFADVSRVYKLGYATVSGSYRQRLNSVSVCELGMTTCSAPTTFAWTTKTRGTEALDYVSSVSNPYAVQTNITYKNLSDPSVYVVKRVRAQEPTLIPIAGVFLPYFRQIPANGDYSPVKKPDMYVVSRASQSNGVGGWVDTDYRYTNLRSHKKVMSRTAIRAGRGLAAFEVVEAINQTARTRATTRYAYTFPYTGMVSSQEQSICLGAGTLDFTSSCELLKKVENQFDSKASGNVFFPYIKKATVTQYEMPSGI